MSNQLNRNTGAKLKNKSKNSGFSLIEVTVALVTMGLCLAYALPLILYSKINNSKSEMRTGALMVSQRIFDDIRGKTFGSIPSTDTSITNTSTPTALPVEQTQSLGHNYNVEVRYCEPTTATPPVNECTDSYRKFKITIRDTVGDQTSDNSIIYQTEAAFTSFN
jgi:prepilin-type N-terminal cleavage/methylation domain-containing protein